MEFKLLSIQALAMKRDTPSSDVPCGDCVACCVHLSPNLSAEEVASGKYVYTFLTTEDPSLPIIGIPRNEEGCYYLKNSRCSIYEDRPLACRQFDCRSGHYHKFKDLVKKKFNLEMPDEPIL